MNDHLPECWAVMCECEDTHFYSQACSYGCICPSLRACEERILNLNSIALGVLIAQRARERALDAAREAVAATFIGWCKDYMNCTDYEHVCGKRREIIAAIDALREVEK